MAQFKISAKRAHRRAHKASGSKKSGHLSSLNIPLQAELSLYANMIDHIGDELMLINSEGRIVFANEATAKGLGYTKKYLLNKRIVDFFKEKITLAAWKRTHFAEIKRKKAPVSFRVERVAKKGKIQTIDITAVYMPYNSRGFVLSIARDVSKEYGIQRALAESENHYRLLCEQAADPIFSLDPEGGITYCNQAGVDFLKVPFKKMRGMHFEKFTAADSLPQARYVFDKVIQGNAMVSVALESRSAKGENIPVEVTAYPQKKDGKVMGVQAIVRDVSHRKEIDLLVRESEKMQAVQYFVNGTAQELKNPLLGVLKRSQSLLNRYEHRDFEYIGYKEFTDIMTTLKSMRARVQYCYDTTERLLSLNQKRAGVEKNTCHANRVIHEVVDLKAGAMHMNAIHYKLQLAGKLPAIAMGKFDFNQVLSNLINNAIQAMPAGGQLVIRTQYRAADKKIKIEVKDDGVGIARHNLVHLFEPFFTTKQRGVGLNSGLGLPIVYSLVKAVRGDIKVESSLRKGTSFIILVPAATH